MSKNKPWLKAKKRDHTTGAGKGDKYRPVDRKQYEKNYDAIFNSAKKVNEKHKKTLEKLNDEDKDIKRT
jgi:hypothetical protein